MNLLFSENVGKFFIDSGAEMNLVKCGFQGDVRVNEGARHQIRGSNQTPVNTIGTVNIPIDIRDACFKIQFDVVSDNFPWPEAGSILGRTFLKQNKAVIDLHQELVILPGDTNENVHTTITTT